MQAYLDGGGRGSTGLWQEMLRCLAADMFHGRAFPPEQHVDRIMRSLATPADALPLRAAHSALAGLGAGFSSLGSVNRALHHAYNVQKQPQNSTSDLEPRASATGRVGGAWNEQARAHSALHSLRTLRTRLRSAAGARAMPVHAAMQEVWEILGGTKEEAEAVLHEAGEHEDWAWGQAMCTSVAIMRDYLQRLPPAPAAPALHHLTEDMNGPVAGLLDRILTQWAAHKLLPSVQLYYELMRLLHLRIAKRLVTAGLAPCPPRPCMRVTVCPTTSQPCTWISDHRACALAHADDKDNSFWERRRETR